MSLVRIGTTREASHGDEEAQVCPERVRVPGGSVGAADRDQWLR